MKIDKNYIILLILIFVFVFFIIIYPSTQVSKTQYSSFYGNIEDFNLRGKDCLVEFNAEGISFASNEYRIDSVRNITIESNGKKRLINYSSSIYVKNHDYYNAYLPVGNGHVDIFLGNSTISKHSNTIGLTGDMSNGYMNNIKPKNGTREVAIRNYNLDYLNVDGEDATDFEIIYFELDENSEIWFYSKNISLIANTISDFEIQRSVKSQMLEMTLILGEGTLLLDDHLFEIKGSNILNIELLPQTQGKNLYIDNTKARFFGFTNSAGLNTEDILISDLEYWIKIEPEKLNAYAVVILVILTGSYAYQVNKQTNLTMKANKRITVLDCVDNFLKPCLKDMEEYIKYINNDNFYWNQSNGMSQISWIWKTAHSESGEGFAKVDVFEKHRDLEVLCSEYDVLHEELIQVYDEIANVIKNTADEDCLKKRVEKFMEETGNVFGVEPNNNPVEYFLQKLVNCEYYRKHGDEEDIDIKYLRFDENVLNCINTPEYNELDGIRNKKIGQLKEKIDEIIGEIDTILRTYRREYHIP